MSAKRMPAQSKLVNWHAVHERDKRAKDLAERENISFTDAVLKILDEEQSELFRRGR